MTFKIIAWTSLCIAAAGLIIVRTYASLVATAIWLIFVATYMLWHAHEEHNEE